MKQKRQYRMVYRISAVMIGLISMATVVFANPDLMKKCHDGYPNENQRCGSTTATGTGALMKSQDTAPKVLREQLEMAKEYDGQLQRRGAGQLPQTLGSKYVGERGVEEGHIKKSTRVQANPEYCSREVWNPMEGWQWKSMPCY